MNACVSCCGGGICDKWCSGQCGFLNRCFPKPFSFITTLLVLVHLIFMALTIIFLIIESASDDFVCPKKILAHPIIMIGVGAINIAVYIAIYCYYNSQPSISTQRPPSMYFLKKTANLLCYKIVFCFYYVFIIGFVVFVILGETILKAQSEACLHSFRITLAFDAVLMALFFFVIVFGAFLACCGINYNSRDGCGTTDSVKFALNILSCGICFKEYFASKNGSADNRPYNNGDVVVNTENQAFTAAAKKPKKKEGPMLMKKLRDIWNE